MSWEVIIPFLRPIEPLIRDPHVSDILVNGDGRVFVERLGEMAEAPHIAMAETSLQVAVRNIARVLGYDVTEENPILDARLPDGSRVAAVFPPISVTGTAVAIRKFHGRVYTAEELVNNGTVTPEALMRLKRAVEERRNILICGGTGTGKTTLLSALSRFIAPEERVVVIEDTSELQIQAANLVRLEARREQTGMRKVTIRDLLKATLRLRPDRIILGEVRGGEAFDLLQALNTGHSGTMATIHANSALDALGRFTTCTLMSGVELPYRAIRNEIGRCISYVIRLDRHQGKRIVCEMTEMGRYDPQADTFDLINLGM